MAAVNGRTGAPLEPSRFVKDPDTGEETLDTFRNFCGQYEREMFPCNQETVPLAIVQVVASVGIILA